MDTETNGFLDNPESVVTEIACALVDFDEKRVVENSSVLFNAGEHVVIPKEITDLTGITRRHLTEFGHDKDHCQMFIDYWFNLGDAVMARNGVEFDSKILARSFKLPENMIMIDDMLDIDYPSWVKGRTLSYIAADHGFLNPFPHSAMGDVLTLAFVMLKGGYDMNAAFESAKTPVVEVKADVSFYEKDLAKSAGFSFNSDLKIWTKKMRQFKYEKCVREKLWKFQTQFRILS